MREKMKINSMSPDTIINHMRFFIYRNDDSDYSNKFVIDLLHSQVLTEELMNWITFYIKNNVLLNKLISMDLLKAYIYGIKKINKYDYYLLHCDLLIIYDTIYKTLLMKSNCYNTYTSFYCKLYHLLWFCTQSKKMNMINNVISRLFNISTKLPNKLRLHCRNTIFTIIVNFCNNEYFNMNISYTTFKVMFPEKKDELDSYIFLNKLI